MLRIMGKKIFTILHLHFLFILTFDTVETTTNNESTSIRITALEGTSPRHPPRSILVLSGQYHIMSNASIVNNCIMSTSLKSIIVYYYPQLRIGNLGSAVAQW